MWDEMLADGYVAVLDANGKPLAKRGWHRSYAKEFPTPEELKDKKTWESTLPEWFKLMSENPHHYEQQKRIYDYDKRNNHKDDWTSYALKA